MTSEELDALWDYGKPAEKRAKFEELLANSEGDFVAEILTQIARCYGLEGNFKLADEALDAADSKASVGSVAAMRAVLERGRVRRTSKTEGAVPLFQQAESMAHEIGASFYEVDAIHMRALVEPDAESITSKGIQIAESSEDPRCRRWRIALNSNIGWNRHDAGDYDSALPAFRAALAAAEEWGEASRINVAYWSIARCLRSMGRIEEALSMQLDLAEDPVPDGYVFLEVAECQLYLERYDQAKDAGTRASELLPRDARAQMFDSATVDDLQYERFFDGMYRRKVEEKIHKFDYDGPMDRFEENVIRSWSEPHLKEKASAEQIGQAVWEILNEVDWQGTEIFDAATILFRETLEPLASHRLANESHDHLDVATFMFWDIARWYADKKAATEEQIRSFVALCSECLKSPKASIQESALHGLGHAVMYIDTAKLAIDDYIEAGQFARPELKAYAKDARRGMIQ